jgi:ribosomal protein L9
LFISQGGKRKEETKSSLKRAQLRKEELARRAQQEADAAQAIALKFKWQRVLNVNVTNGDGNT